MAKRKRLELSVPGSSPSPEKVKLSNNEDAAPSLPITIDALANGFRVDRDAIKELNIDGYRLLQRSPIVQQPFNKVCKRIKNLDLVFVTNKPGSKYQKAVQEVIDGTRGIPEAIDWMRFGFTEGVTFIQQRVADARETGKNYFYPDIRDGGVHKENANPDSFSPGLRWDRLKIVKRQGFSPYVDINTNKAKTFDRRNFIVFHPGSSTNTEGNLLMARVLLPLAASYERCQRNVDDFIDTFPLPYLIATGALDSVSASAAEQVLNSLAGKIKGLDQTNRVAALGMNRQNVMMLEPQGTACQIMMERMKQLEDQCHQIILGNSLTSNTQNSGPAGSSTVHAQEEDKFIMSYAKDMAGCFTDDLLPYIILINPKIEKLMEEDESEGYFQFQPSGTRKLVGLPEKQLEPEVDVMADKTTNSIPSSDSPTNEGGDQKSVEEEDKEEAKIELIKKKLEASLSLSLNPCLSHHHGT